MVRAGLGIGLRSLFFAVAIPVFAQDKGDASHHYGKAGTWEITTTMTWQKAPPVRSGTPGGPPAAGTHTHEFCLTQAMVDAGALLPQSRGECHIQNKVIKPGSLTAKYVCTGKMKGMGNVETTIPDPEHVNGSIHFVGTLDVGTHPQPIEWTMVSNSVFKGDQCANTPGPSASTPGATASPK